MLAIRCNPMPRAWPIHVFSYPFGVGYYDMHGPEVVPMGFKLTGELLQDAGYTTSAIGKWSASNAPPRATQPHSVGPVQPSPK